MNGTYLVSKLQDSLRNAHKIAEKEKSSIKSEHLLKGMLKNKISRIRKCLKLKDLKDLKTKKTILAWTLLAINHAFSCGRSFIIEADYYTFLPEVFEFKTKLNIENLKNVAVNERIAYFSVSFDLEPDIFLGKKITKNTKFTFDYKAVQHMLEPIFGKNEKIIKYLYTKIKPTLRKKKKTLNTY